MNKPDQSRVALAVMRMQPPHLGHMNLIRRMQHDCGTVIIGFGSTQLSRDPRHPFTYKQRLDMARRAAGDAFHALPLIDVEIRHSNEEWIDYVIDQIHRRGLPTPTDYYTGSAHDASWYTNWFASLDDPHTAHETTRTHHSPATHGRRLHIVDRALSGLPAAEDIRAMIARHDPAWRAFVPMELVDEIEATYPPELRD